MTLHKIKVWFNQKVILEGKNEEHLELAYLRGERECSPVDANGVLRSDVCVDVYCLCWVYVMRTHEPSVDTHNTWNCNICVAVSCLRWTVCLGLWNQLLTKTQHVNIALMSGQMSAARVGILNRLGLAGITFVTLQWFGTNCWQRHNMLTLHWYQVRCLLLGSGSWTAWG